MTRWSGTALLAITAMLAAHQARAERTVWDVATDFSLTHNPNGPWKYSGNHNVLHHTIPAADDTPGIQTYYDLHGIPDGAYIAHNTTHHTITSGAVTIPPDHVLMDPQSGITNIFWEAPRAGTYTLTGDFRGLNYYYDGPHYVHIDVLGRTSRLFTAKIASYNQPAKFSYVLHLKAGDTLNVTVQAGSELYSLGTGLAAHIVASP